MDEEFKNNLSTCEMQTFDMAKKNSCKPVDSKIKSNGTSTKLMAGWSDNSI